MLISHRLKSLFSTKKALSTRIACSIIRWLEKDCLSLLQLLQHIDRKADIVNVMVIHRPVNQYAT